MKTRLEIGFGWQKARKSRHLGGEEQDVIVITIEEIYCSSVQTFTIYRSNMLAKSVDDTCLATI